ncbi:hypothetical protein HG535_0G02770 [Zygotorulaspora mrakii]|uniref:Mitochondrial distribution and morphology protein 12 n=1 Tax=Zygotorulaspora mrakii TaxID=42260 RepID=A0A7H9B816_ZYGMR|nr:uncharacterized protein HG535_0G02770 [Zygotorulaspora mrakii]QLG74394.1 hypothetical protein HG535_0G02770 [Zygotorulaspora mrakii]
MSFEIDWSELESDVRLNESIRKHLNSYLETVSLPSYVGNLRILNFDLGKIAPNITLREISDPLNDFYEAISEDLEQSGSDTEKVEKSPNDVQFLAEVEYNGDMLITVAADLVLNYPTTSFMTLPVKLTISNIGLHSLCLAASLQKQVFISFLCDVSDSRLDTQDSILDASGSLLAPRRSLEQMRLIRSMKIETEIGGPHEEEGSMLRSVGKLEEFLLEKFQELLRKELAWPSWINLDLSDDEEINNVDDCNEEHEAL